MTNDKILLPEIPNNTLNYSLKTFCSIILKNIPSRFRNTAQNKSINYWYENCLNHFNTINATSEKAQIEKKQLSKVITLLHNLSLAGATIQSFEYIQIGKRKPYYIFNLCFNTMSSFLKLYKELKFTKSTYFYFELDTKSNIEHLPNHSNLKIKISDEITLFYGDLDTLKKINFEKYSEYIMIIKILKIFEHHIKTSSFSYKKNRKKFKINFSIEEFINSKNICKCLTTLNIQLLTLCPDLV